MANPWFRMYAEFAHDAKVQMMTEAMQRRYMMLMCMHCSNGLVTLHETEMAFQMRISNDDLAETKSLFISKGFIDSDWNLLNWEKRQFVSDTSNARVAKHRSLSKAKQQQGGNGNVTLPKRKANALDTDTDTEVKTGTVTPPDGVSIKVWSDFLKHRKTKKAAITDTAIAGLKREASKAGVTLEQALVVTIERGWVGFKADWYTDSPDKPNIIAGAI